MTNTPTCIIVDDSHLDRIAIEIELKSFGRMKLLGCFSNAMEASEVIKNQLPDVLFLDVDMPEITGMELLRSIHDYAPVCIMITSHPEFALEGFELKVFDYILKPLETDRFLVCMDRLTDFLILKKKAQAYDVQFESEHVVFKEGYSMIKLDIRSIVYLEAFGDYTKIVTEHKVYLTLTTLSHFLELLPAQRFMRIHRSYVIAVQRARCFNVKSVDMGGDSLLPIGKTYLREAREAFKFI